MDTVEAGDKQEWSPVQPSTENSVKVMTIHQAKGLEFGTVFVPGMAKDLFPNLMVQQNPAERGKSLDFELRGDARILPAFKGNLRHFWLALRDYEEMEERRTCYVSLTRAKRRLFVTGAHWYGEGQKPKETSSFFEELCGWAERSGLGTFDRAPTVPQENPLIGYRERFVRDWPGSARRDEPDMLFPAGWRRVAAEAEGDPVILKALVDKLSAEDRTRFEGEAARLASAASHLVEREAARPPLRLGWGGISPPDIERAPPRWPSFQHGIKRILVHDRRPRDVDQQRLPPPPLLIYPLRNEALLPERAGCRDRFVAG